MQGYLLQSRAGILLQMMGVDNEDDAPESVFYVLRNALGDDEVLLTLLNVYGGCRVSVPLKATDNTVLTKVIGRGALEKLIPLFGGGFVSLPLAKRFRVLAMRRAGKSYSHIAARLCMTEGAVYRHIAAGAQDREVLRRAKSDADRLAKRRKLR